MELLPSERFEVLDVNVSVHVTCTKRLIFFLLKIFDLSFM